MTVSREVCVKFSMHGKKRKESRKRNFSETNFFKSLAGKLFSCLHKESLLQKVRSLNVKSTPHPVLEYRRLSKTCQFHLNAPLLLLLYRLLLLHIEKVNVTVFTQSRMLRVFYIHFIFHKKKNKWNKFLFWGWSRIFSYKILFVFVRYFSLVHPPANVLFEWLVTVPW